MRLIKNTGTERVLDDLRNSLHPAANVDVASTAWSLFAYDELRSQLAGVNRARVLLPVASKIPLQFSGSEADRPYRNGLRLRAIARACADWIEAKAAVRYADSILPQSALIVSGEGTAGKAITGTCSFTTEGLGLAPGSQLALIQASESDDELKLFSAWFNANWDSLPATVDAKTDLLGRIRALVTHQPPVVIYYFMLYHLFSGIDDELDEDRIVKSATGIRNTVVWKKLFKFQRDGVVGAIDKLNRYGGCIIADSVGLGKTFEALAVIKYHELRNDRVLVLCPKRLRDNWTLYKANDRRNFLATDRFNYDVLNHTDLSREGGTSGDIDLANVNWGNYDLVVIDE